MIEFFVVNPDGFISKTGYCAYESDLPKVDGLHFGQCPIDATHFIDGQFVTKIDEQRVTLEALRIRDDLLKNGPDRINPIWFSAMTTEQQQAWADYRQALLDITDQSGFPMMIDWPARPDQAA